MQEKSRTRREERRDATLQEIKDLAWGQMAAHGPDGLSLRAIAREMRTSSAALFRYFENRDALMTALTADAFQAQVTALETACEAIPIDDAAGRLVAIAHAYRAWALADPVKFALMYGTPAVGYRPDWAQIVPLARRGLDLILAVMQAAQPLGGASRAWMPHMPAALREQLAAVIKTRGYHVPTHTLYLALSSWSRLHGLVSLEVFGQLQPLLGDPADLYRYEVQSLLSQAGFSHSKGVKRS
ncbi:MAG: TetR/AcrR family transcriptional regulator [Chloroflexi bacterium]|nr:TetR/AcrR family transcriptional regulator [Chloroflexota bacterium]